MEYKIVKVKYTMPKAIFTKDHKDLIEKLKKAREDAGLDQAEVA